MRRTILLYLFVLMLPKAAFAFSSIACGLDDSGHMLCPYAINLDTAYAAADAALKQCHDSNLQNCLHRGPGTSFENTCKAVAHPLNSETQDANGTGSTVEQARNSALATCRNNFFTECTVVIGICDRTPPARTAIPVQSPIGQHSTSLSEISFTVLTSLLNLGAIGTGISFGIGLIIALLIFAKRAAIANVLIHGNLPYKLPVYGEDIQCLFKRTQRVNWYGRVIFCIVINLAMTHQQLIDIRKYWLGRVVTFDSLRRQRQNQLARMHYQLAAAAKSEAYDKKKFWSRRWATVRTFFRRLFWIFAALFRLLFSFFFIRVNIAKLVRGTVVESSDLTLILQAKEAIDESARYLKEYLETANTFDGRDEIV